MASHDSDARARFRVVSWLECLSLRRLVVNLLLVLAVLLVGTTAVLFAVEASRGTASPPFGSRIATFDAAEYGGWKDCYNDVTNQEIAYVALVIGGFDRENETLRVSPTVCLPTQVFEHHLHRLGAHNIEKATLPIGETFKLRDGTANEPFGLSVDQVYPGGTGRSHVFPAEVGQFEPAYEPTFHGTTLGRMWINGEHKLEGPQTLRPFDLPLASDPGQYPFDSYVSSAALSLGAPEGPREARYVYCTSQFCSGAVPARFQIFKEPSLAGFAVAVGTRAARFHNRDRQTVLTVRLARPAATKLYVMVLAILPLVFALLLLIAFVRRPAGADIRGEVIAGIAATLLAVLPIRLVLVPSELTGLTLIDYLLGLEMAVLTGLACFVVWRGLTSRADAAG
jgi:hypothetical protein